MQPQDSLRGRRDRTAGQDNTAGGVPVPGLNLSTEDCRTLLSIHNPPGTRLSEFPTGSGHDGTLANTAIGDTVYYTKTAENGRKLHGPHTVLDIRLTDLPRMSRPFLNLPGFYLDKEDFMIPVNPRRIVRADKLKKSKQQQ